MIALACGIAALAAAGRIAFAQAGSAGSTGGTIGKTDKSVSGGELQQQAPGHESNIGAASSSLTGRWQWQADCGFLGRFFGDFRMTQSPGGHLTGQWLRDSGGTTGHIDGTVVGEKVSFTLQGGKDGLVRQYDAVLNSKDKPSRMIGSLRASVASCAFTASRD